MAIITVMVPSPEVRELRSRVATQLDLVASGTVSADEALRQLESGWSEPKDRLSTDAWHSLVHFRDDEDIHVRDPVYRASQQEGLRKWARKLGAER